MKPVPFSDRLPKCLDRGSTPRASADHGQGFGGTGLRRVLGLVESHDLVDVPTLAEIGRVREARRRSVYGPDLLAVSQHSIARNADVVRRRLPPDYPSIAR